VTSHPGTGYQRELQCRGAPKPTDGKPGRARSARP